MQRQTRYAPAALNNKPLSRPNDIRKLVLCIDDEAPGLAVRKLLLEQAGYAVTTCCDGNNGLELFTRMPVRIVVLDYAMPGLNGAEVAKLMREVKPKVPIVMLSGCEDQPSNTKDSVDIYIVKGGNPEFLLSHIARLLTDREPGNETPAPQVPNALKKVA